MAGHQLHPLGSSRTAWRAVSGAIALLLAVALSPVDVLAGAVQGGLDIQIGRPGQLMSINPQTQGEMFMDPNTGTMFWQSTQDLSGDGWMIPLANGGLNISANPDPFITTGFTLLNTFAGTSDFVVSVAIFSVDSIPSPIISGATDYDLTDANNSGSATLAQESGLTSSLYNAFFGGDGDVRTLLPPGAGLPLVTANPAIGSVGGSYSDEAAGAALSIGEAFGIRHEFSLTSFDRVTVQSTFVIVPEPSSLALVGIAAACLLIRRRRG